MVDYMPQLMDRAKPVKEATAQILEIAKGLPLPVHDDHLKEPVARCAGSGRKPEEVYSNMHVEVAPVTAFCPGDCFSIFALIPAGKSFRWEDKGVYGFSPNGTPQGP